MTQLRQGPAPTVAALFVRCIRELLANTVLQPGAPACVIVPQADGRAAVAIKLQLVTRRP